MRSTTILRLRKGSRETLETALGKDNVVTVEPLMVSEDYAYFIQQGIPSFYFALGGADPRKYADAKITGTKLPYNHSPLFAPDVDPALRTGIVAEVAVLRDLLNTSPTDLYKLTHQQASPYAASRPCRTTTDIEAALNYHNATKHSYASVRSNPHFLDFANQPLPFKIYPTLEPLRLPGRNASNRSGCTFSDCRKRPCGNQRGARPADRSLSSFTFPLASPGRESIPDGEIYFRAAACTGALYEVELYLVCGDLTDLQAGVYHFAPAEFGLRKLRAGDYPQRLSRSHRR